MLEVSTLVIKNLSLDYQKDFHSHAYSVAPSDHSAVDPEI